MVCAITFACSYNDNNRSNGSVHVEFYQKAMRLERAVELFSFDTCELNTKEYRLHKLESISGKANSKDTLIVIRPTIDNGQAIIYVFDTGRQLICEEKKELHFSEFKDFFYKELDAHNHTKQSTNYYDSKEHYLYRVFDNEYLISYSFGANSIWENILRTIDK
jgi:hypothetical protein